MRIAFDTRPNRPCSSSAARSGFGQALAQQALATGHSVIGTLRSAKALEAFEAQSPHAHGVLLDVTDFAAIDGAISQAREEKSGKQLGDPVKAAQAMLQLIESDNPPAHLLLGSDALKLVREKMAQLSEEIDQWEALTRSTDG